MPSVAVGNVIGALLLLFFMLFGGFLLNNESAPSYVQWLQELSFFNHALEAMTSNELAGASYQFDPVICFVCLLVLSVVLSIDVLSFFLSRFMCPGWLFFC